MYSLLQYLYNRLNLRTALSIPFVLLILLGVGLTGWLSLQNSERAINDVTLQLRQEISTRIQEHLDYYLQIPQTANLHIINGLQHGLVELGQSQMMIQHFIHQLKVNPHLSHLQISTPQGETIGIEHGEDGFFRLELANEVTNFDLHVYKVDTEGKKIQAKPLRIIPNYDPRQLDWYVKAKAQLHPHWSIRSGKSQWSHILNFLGHTWLALSYSTPIFTVDGELQAVISSDVVLDKVSEFLRSLKVGRSGHTFIIERNDDLVATSTQDKLFKLDLMTVKTQRFSASDSENKLIYAAEAYLHEKFSELDQIQQTLSLNFQLDGKRHFLQVVPYRLEGIDWLILVVVPEADYMDKIDENKKITLTFMFLTSIIAGLIAIILVSWLTRPLLMLNVAAQKLTAGDWEHEFDNHDRQDEVGHLSRAFQQMVAQLKDLFDNLEAKVSERTYELEQANEEIRALNEYLQADNIRMTAELDVTRQFQQMILPKREELEAIKELDIASFMEPAEEVGGDYYDVLRYGDSIKIAIGDVTGHGLASGMLMLMVQTAIRTLYVNKICSPDTCLVSLNRVIYDNLQRMRSDKNLTLCIIDYYGEGNLVLSGQHEEVLLVRSDGQVECINTIKLGFMIGLLPDIENMVDHQHFHLAPGEGIVLYTDGITEAMNQQKKQYGLERLVEVVSKNWVGTSAQTVQQAVIDDVKAYSKQSLYQDDLTLVVLKRC